MMMIVMAMAVVLMTAWSGEATWCGPMPEKTVVVVVEGLTLDTLQTHADELPYLNQLVANGTAFSGAVGACCGRGAQGAAPESLAAVFVRLFAGLSTRDVDKKLMPADDSPPKQPWGLPNLYTQLASAGASFAGFSEGMQPSDPLSAVPQGDAPRLYLPARAPWSSLFFSNVPSDVHRPLSAFPTDSTGFPDLPAVSFIVPDTCHDFSGRCPLSVADQWLSSRLGSFIDWALAGPRLFILLSYAPASSSPSSSASALYSHSSPVMLLMNGGLVHAGLTIPDHVDHFSVVRLLLDLHHVIPSYHGTVKAGSFPDALWRIPPSLVPPPAVLPRPDHILLVMMENKKADEIFGNELECPFTNELIRQGAFFNQSFALTHPSQPNYLYLFAGDAMQVFSDGYMQPLSHPVANLASALHNASLTLGSFSEGLPATGYNGGDQNPYLARHNPARIFPPDSFPAEWNMPFNEFKRLRDGGDFCALPTVSLVIPDMCNDQHSCSIAKGDAWMRKELGSYVDWAQQHNSLLILHYDEDSMCLPCGNRIPTVFAGAMVKPGTITNHQIDHVDLLRMLLDMYGLQPFRQRVALACPMQADVWLRETTGSGVCPASDCPLCSHAAAAAQLALSIGPGGVGCSSILALVSEVLNRDPTEFCASSSGGKVLLSMNNAGFGQNGPLIQLVLLDEHGDQRLRSAGIYHIHLFLSSQQDALKPSASMIIMIMLMMVVVVMSINKKN